VAKGDEQTPLMKQYWELKAKAPDSLLFFRMGDFYELFGDDAIEASRILEITLTSRDKNKENPMPMCGFPWHSAEPYIQKILNAGRKVAIGEQVGPVGGKEIVRRELVRQFTPGIQFNLEGSEACFLGAALAIAPTTPNAASASSVHLFRRKHFYKISKPFRFDT
jgi:DNA mismatch repair ATPase MutS